MAVDRPAVVPAVEHGRSLLDEVRSARGFIFDMDGVLYRGQSVLPGVNDFLNALDIRGRRYMLATNNSSATAAEYVVKLARMGVTVTEDSIITSAMATRDYLEQTLPAGSGIFVIGSPSLRSELFSNAVFHPVQYGEETPAAVVVGIDTTFTYEKLKLANTAIRAGAAFVATNGDLTLPTEEGLLPGCGSLVAAVTAASGATPVVIGKPEPLLLQEALGRMSVGPDEAVMIGDRLDTDIVAGKRAGMLTILVLTGVSTREDVADATVRPDLIFTDLPGVLEAIVAR
jgi:HAD superfamily hydrolase (TIGR01457 family)